MNVSDWKYDAVEKVQYYNQYLLVRKINPGDSDIECMLRLVFDHRLV
jgi:hypothetical protein